MDNNELQSNLANIRSLIERINQFETAEHGAKPEDAEARMAATEPEVEKPETEEEDEMEKAKKEAEEAEEKAKKARERIKAMSKKAVTVSTPSEAGTADDKTEEKIDADNESHAEDLAAAETKALLGQLVKGMETLAKKMSAFETFKSDMQEAIGISDTVLTQKSKEEKATRAAKAQVNAGDSMEVVKALLEQVAKNAAPASGEVVDPRYARNSEVNALSMKIANAFTDEAIARRGN